MTKIQQQELIASYNYVTIHLYLHENITCLLLWEPIFMDCHSFFFYNFVHGNVFKWIHFHKKIDNDQISWFITDAYLWMNGTHKNWTYLKYEKWTTVFYFTIYSYSTVKKNKSFVHVSNIYFYLLKDQWILVSPTYSKMFRTPLF